MGAGEREDRANGRATDDVWYTPPADNRTRSESPRPQDLGRPIRIQVTRGGGVEHEREGTDDPSSDRANQGGLTYVAGDEREMLGQPPMWQMSNRSRTQLSQRNKSKGAQMEMGDLARIRSSHDYQGQAAADSGDESSRLTTSDASNQSQTHITRRNRMEDLQVEVGEPTRRRAIDNHQNRPSEECGDDSSSLTASGSSDQNLAQIMGESLTEGDQEYSPERQSRTSAQSLNTEMPAYRGLTRTREGMLSTSPRSSDDSARRTSRDTNSLRPQLGWRTPEGPRASSSSSSGSTDQPAREDRMVIREPAGELVPHRAFAPGPARNIRPDRSQSPRSRGTVYTLSSEER